MDRIDDVKKRFQDGCACSQAVLSAYGEELGLSRAAAMKISAGFGSGMGMGETCGAVTGAFMVLGLHAPEECHTREGRRKVQARFRAFARQFREKNGSLLCRELLKCDITTPEGNAKAVTEKLLDTRCLKMVTDAAVILEEMLQTKS